MAKTLNVSRRDGVLLTTTDATATVMATFTPKKSKVYWAEFKVIATYADNSLGASYWKQGAFRCNSSGTLTAIGTTGDVSQDNEDTAGMDVTMASTDGQIKVTVTGVAATTIYWRLWSEIAEVDASSVN